MTLSLVSANLKSNLASFDAPQVFQARIPQEPYTGHYVLIKGRSIQAGLAKPIDLSGCPVSSVLQRSLARYNRKRHMFVVTSPIMDIPELGESLTSAQGTSQRVNEAVINTKTTSILFSLRA